MSKTDRILSLITARGGSKSIPRKNIRSLAGKPLIAWSIEAAKRIADLDRLIVSKNNGEQKYLLFAPAIWRRTIRRTPMSSFTQSNG
jgi:CMP-N-acetylneuraminic acid synthetase